MDTQHALVAFDALSQETRLRIFRTLVEYGDTGLAAGALADRLKVAQNTLSFHLQHLSHAGLVTSRREGRSIVYAANFTFFTGLIRFMVDDCCRADVARVRSGSSAGMSVIELSDCCAPAVVKVKPKTKEKLQ